MATKEGEFVKGKTDRVFRTIVADEKDPRFLEAILGACLKEKIKIKGFHLTELPVSNVTERTKTVDVLVSTEDKAIHVEVNSKFDRTIRTRNLNFFTVIYQAQTKRGKEYNTKIKIVHVDINFNESKKDLERRVHRLASEEDGKVYTNNFEVITINVARIKKDWYDNVINDEDNIYLVMLDADEQELRELGKRNTLVKEFGEKVMKLNKIDPWMFGVTAEQDREMIFNSRLREAKERATEKGIKKGMKKGIQQGMEQGLQQGIEQGISLGEKQKQLEIAKNFLKDGISIEIVSKNTGLTIEEIKKLNG